MPDSVTEPGDQTCLDLTCANDQTLALPGPAPSVTPPFPAPMSDSSRAETAQHTTRSWPTITALTLLIGLTVFSVYKLTDSVRHPPVQSNLSQSPLAIKEALTTLKQALSDAEKPGTNALQRLRQAIRNLPEAALAASLEHQPVQSPTNRVSVSTVRTELSPKSSQTMAADRLLADLDALESDLKSETGTTISPPLQRAALSKIEHMQVMNGHLLATANLLDESQAQATYRHQQLVARHGQWVFLLLGLLTAGLLAMALQQWLGFRHQNRQLSHSNSRLKDAIEGLPDGCVVMNHDREVTAHNRQLIDLLPQRSSVDGANATSLYQQICHDSTVNRDALSDWLDNLSADSTSAIELLDHQERQLLIRERPTGNGQITATIRDITDTTNIARQLQEVADYDSLTSLPNRALFMRTLRERTKAVDAPEFLSIALIVCDLRDFRQINESYGQETGDQVLVKIADALKESMPASADLARISGDEFGVIIQPAENRAQIESATSEFLTLLRDGFSIGNRHIPVRASIGISYAPEHGLSPTELKNTADSACAQARHRSSHSFQIFDRQLQASADREHTIDVGLSRAIESHELQIEYQPQIDIKSNLTAGMEALLRWDSPELGRVSPAEFIPRAEKTGLILELGNWVLTKSINDYQRLSQFVTASGTLSVNLSRKQFDDPNLLVNIKQIVADTGMIPSQLTLEITETAILDDRDHARRVLNELHCLGFNLSIDDFGVGYSSLLELRDFPVNEVKIDRSFVVNVAECRNSRKIIQAIVMVADAIGADVVAEGIESRTQFEWVRKLGCHRAQGYFLCEPMSATTFPDVVLGGRDPANA